MLRNLQLINRILIAIEAAPYDAPLQRTDLCIEGFESDAVRYNLGLAISAALVEVGPAHVRNPRERWSQGEAATGLWLTWKGHGYLDDQGIIRP